MPQPLENQYDPIIKKGGPFDELRIGPGFEPPMGHDSVEQPSHYTYGGIETIDYMRAKSTPEEFIGYLRLTVMKYISRAGRKDSTLQDLRKAQWYLSRLIQEVGHASPDTE